MKILYLTCIVSGLCLAQHQANAQLLNKVRQKLENAAEQSVNKALGTDKNASSSPTSPTASSGSRARNKGGAGLVTTPPM
ncbi:hypothetical protein [Adhaeribacter arboris]|nr:hypothetical protein [Adhaeribacter arboris]